MFLSETSRGLRPRTPGHFLCGQKVTKKPHGRRNPFDGVSPRAPLFRDDTKGGRPPPFGNPRISSSLSVRRWKRLAGIARRESGVQAFSPTAKTLAQGRIHSARANEILRGPRAVHRTVRGRIQRGGRSPLIGRRGGGVHRGGTPSKGSLPYAPFWVLFRRGKSTPGCGAGSPTKRGAGAKPPHNKIGSGAEAPAAFQSATDTVTRSTPSMARWMSPSMSRAASYWTTSSSTGWVRGWRGVKTVQQSS